jgi:hypothetical protein
VRACGAGRALAASECFWHGLRLLTPVRSAHRNSWVPLELNPTLTQFWGKIDVSGSVIMCFELGMVRGKGGGVVVPTVRNTLPCDARA